VWGVKTRSSKERMASGRRPMGMRADEPPIQRSSLPSFGCGWVGIKRENWRRTEYTKHVDSVDVEKVKESLFRTVLYICKGT